MPTATPLRMKVLTAGALVPAALACVLLAAGNRTAAEPFDLKKQEDKWAAKNMAYQEAALCMNCHAQPNNQGVLDNSLDFVLMTEYSIWKTFDKHAQAYAVLEGPQGQAMAKILKTDVTKPEAGCLSCHAMSTTVGKAPGQDTIKYDGVSCGGCHGPSLPVWIGKHNQPNDHTAWRLLPAGEKQADGLLDLRDAETKATLCLSCHVGNPAQGKVVSHAMFAAGHPPLPPVEVASFCRNQPQHWRDAIDVPYFQNLEEAKTPGKNWDKAKIKEAKIKAFHLETMRFQQTELALIGSVVALRETMNLVVGRADLKAENAAQLWPELLSNLDGQAAKDANKLRGLAAENWPEIAMAHSDCYACHHDLKYPGFRQERGFGYQLAKRPMIRVTPGRPVIRGWPLALVESAATFAGKPEKVGELEQLLRELAAACNSRPFGKPDEIGKVAAKIVTWCNGVIADLQKGELYNEKSARQLLLNLCSLYEPGTGEDGKKRPPAVPDYEAARQVASAIRMVYREWKGKDAAPDPDVDKVLGELDKQLNLMPYTKRPERLQTIIGIVEKNSGTKDIKGTKEFGDYVRNANKIGDKATISGFLNNPFLTEMRRISNDAFNKALIDNSKVLQQYGNEELQVTLQSIADYDPQLFRQHLAALAKALEEKK